MSRPKPWLRWLTATLLIAGAACSRCDKAERRLKPLPSPPALDLRSSSTAGAPLKVVVATPTQDGQRGDVRPAVTFSKPVVALGAIDEMRRRLPTIAVEPPIAGEWKWIGSSSVELVPKDKLPLSTRFKITV